MDYTRILLVIWISLLTGSSLLSQNKAMNRDSYRLHMKRVEELIQVDGELSEDAWKNAEVARNFHRVLPTDEGYAHSQSEVMMCYDKNNCYIAIICHDTVAGKRPVESLRRDFSFGKNDNFIVFIDTYNDQTNGFAFGISAAGAQWEGIQADGGFVSLNWDTKWSSAVVNHPDKWVVEFAIPFRSIRYKAGTQEWGINFSRLDLKTGEKSSWAPVPRQFQTANLSYTGTVSWDEPLEAKGLRYSLIPYVFGQVSKNIENGEDANLAGKVGMDAKLTLSTSLNLDLSLNPDFSQVEVDRQRTNLERFELFFPERRQFFLENSDLFASLGAVNNRPFFSRRIGLNSPVIGGARLSGKLSKSTRIGVMNMQTGTEEERYASNFSVLTLQQRIFARSNVSVFLVNKDITIPKGELPSDVNRFNRVAGIDLNLSSADNRWTAKIFHHQSFYEGASAEDFTSAANLAYDTEQLSIGLDQSWIGEDYQAEVGFVRRTGIFRFNPSVGYKFFPESKHVANHGPKLEQLYVFNKEFQPTDRTSRISYSLTWLDRSNMSISVEENYIRLLAPFDPTNTGGDSLATGEEFRWNRIGGRIQSAPRNLFTYALDVSYGGFFNGNLMSVSGELNYRVQPYGNFGIIGSYDRLRLPLPYNSADFLLLGPKLDITFTDKMFLTAFTQYNSQLDNLNLNLRFQWRYAPGSDLFIVYTDNSYPKDLTAKDKGLVAKLSYWFN